MKSIFFCSLLIFLCAGFLLAQSTQVKRELLKVMMSNGDVTRSCVRQQGGGVEAIAVDLVQLNGDNVAEYMVSGNGSCCIGARRCNTWIYQKSRNGYVKIFGGREGLQGDVQVLGTRTNGWCIPEMIRLARFINSMDVAINR